MIKVKVHLFFKKYVGNDGVVELEGPFCEDFDVEKLIEKLGIPKEEVGIVIINGKWQDFKSRLSDGDSIEIFPQYLGG
ncbi:MoaD/ThiS family protein [Thermovorax subterraneus]|nr:MoaD/ThiS family protein [Thermovorax subterraneus]